MRGIESELFAYRPPLSKQSDFEAFWERTVKQAREVPLNARKVPFDYPSPYVKVYSVTFTGFDQTPVHGWYMVPNLSGDGPYPCLVQYPGLHQSRGYPADFLQWTMMDIAVLSVDCRGQLGETGNYAAYSSGSSRSVVCGGILDKEEYYFRAVYMDCLKAIDFACAQKETDALNIIVSGASQGGALGLAVCALDDRPTLALVDVPSNSDIQRRVEGRYGSFEGVADYLKAHPDKTEEAYNTLSYFDTMNMADKIKCEVYASVGLADDICPAKFFFATYNRIKSQKEIELYPFNGHEGGGAFHTMRKLRHVQKYFSE